MPIPPKPFLLICPNCGYTKTITPKSDVINLADFLSLCPKCGKRLERREKPKGFFEKFFGKNSL